jgi:hypothetical protein
MTNIKAETSFRLIKFGLWLIAIGIVAIFYLIMMGNFSGPCAPATPFKDLAMFAGLFAPPIGILICIFAGIRAFFKGY